jgi:hypothetical protein
MNKNKSAFDTKRTLKIVDSAKNAVKRQRKLK